MTKQTDKDLVDGFCRSVILDWINRSKYCHNSKLKEYILHDASYEYVVLTTYKKLVQEDASSDIKLSKAEEMFSGLFSFGVAMFAAPPLQKYTHTLLRWKFLQASSGIITYLGISVGISLITKIIFSILRKIMSKCKKDCEKTISKNVNNRDLLVNICSTKCRMDDLKFHISRMRSEVIKCKTISQNPEACQENLIKQIAKMNNFLTDETKKLKEYNNQFRSKK